MREVIERSRSEETTDLGVEISNIKVTSAFTPSGVKSLILYYYKCLLMTEENEKFPALLIIGPPGIGKSTVVREAAEEISKRLGKTLVDITSLETRRQVLKDIDRCLGTGSSSKCINDLPYFVFLDLRLTEVEPADLVGVPRVIRSKGVEFMEYIPPSWAKILHYLPGILFLDELSNVNRVDVMSVAYKILLDRSAGFINFNKNVMVIAAGNQPEHAPGISQPLPPPVLSRCIVIYMDAPTIDEWYKWMIDAVNRRFVFRERVEEGLRLLDLVYAFLSTYPDHFMSLSLRQRRNENFPTPRNWSNMVFTLEYTVLKKLTETWNIDALTSIVASYVGERTANEIVPMFVDGIRINIDEFIDNPQKISEFVNEVKDDRAKLNRLIALVGALASRFRYSAHVIDEEKLLKIIDEVRRAGDGLRTGLGCSFTRVIYKSLNQSLASAVRQRGVGDILDLVAMISKYIDDSCTKHM
ncbi:MAG: AAA family ATPase [Ignisphaera sp.]